MELIKQCITLFGRNGTKQGNLTGRKVRVRDALELGPGVRRALFGKTNFQLHSGNVTDFRIGLEIQILNLLPVVRMHAPPAAELIMTVPARDSWLKSKDIGPT